MERRLILAIALSLLVLLIWSGWVSKTYHPDNKAVTTKPFLPESVVSSPPPVSTPEPEIPASSLLELSQKNFDVIFSEPQAAIKEIIFKDYQSYKFPLKHAFWLEDAGLVFQKESISNEGVTFIYNDKDKQIIKRFIFSKSNYYIELEIEMQNFSNTLLDLNLPLVLGVLDFGKDSIEARYKDVIVATTPDKVLHLNGRKDDVFLAVEFLSLRDRYFCAIIEPVEKNPYNAWIRKINPQETAIGLQPAEFKLLPQQKIAQKFRIYLGPQDLKIINSIKPGWSRVMYYGTFNFISHLLLQVLEILYRLVHNWGWAIVSLSLLIYFLLYPLTLRQMRSMKEMQALQPHIEELRKTYKDNPQKLNKEIMDLYRQHNVNPLRGCLPLILQLPIFFALYKALMRSVSLKGARFLWIRDLSAPDRLFSLPVSLPILGNEINILPIVMAIGMFIQQKFSLSSAGSGSAEQQRLMAILFPVMFGLIFYRMPSALVLYWFINSMLMLIYQFRITRKR